jgi:ABC-type multidrug transport system ATPase subunit
MIEATGLARTFHTRRGPVEAVRGVDFAVHAGEIVGFLGPNGAGKTTVAGCDLLGDPDCSSASASSPNGGSVC